MSAAVIELDHFFHLAAHDALLDPVHRCHHIRTGTDGLFDDYTATSSTSASSIGVGASMWVPDLHGDEHNVQELFIPPAVDDDVDGGVDDEGEVVDVNEGLDPVWPIFEFSVKKQLKNVCNIDF
jgi:hypothetical protein